MLLFQMIAFLSHSYFMPCRFAARGARRHEAARLCAEFRALRAAPVTDCRAASRAARSSAHALLRERVAADARRFPMRRDALYAV